MSLAVVLAAMTRGVAGRASLAGSRGAVSRVAMSSTSSTPVMDPRRWTAAMTRGVAGRASLAGSRGAVSRVAMSSMSSTPVMDPRRWTSRLVDSAPAPVALTVVPKSEWKGWLAAQPAATRGWLESLGRAKFKAGEWTAIPSADGSGLARVVCAVANASSIYSIASLPAALPAGRAYALELVGASGAREATAAATAWTMGSYEYPFLKSDAKPVAAPPTLVWPAGCDRAAVERAACATYLCRDLVTTPCEQLGPADIERATRELAARHPGASVRSVVGDALLVDEGGRGVFPMIHAVGRAAGKGREPRLVELVWSARAGAPEVALVGKGVAFDTGGLDIKPSAAMLTMKKDMGGAAHVLGLASMVMAGKLDVSLRVLLAVVENAISADAFRPGDVLVARNGRTTEIGNTDAEGRLVLADALVLASESNPELIVDMATLTGASRVALGTDVPSIFSNDDALAQELQALSAAAEDHVWQLPLWEGYRKQLKSSVADLKNVGAGAYGGAITAALYLDEFVGAKAKKRGAKPADADDDDDEAVKGERAKGPRWLHMDVMAYNTAASPGRPEGGEAMGMRAFYALLEKRYPAK